MSRLIFYGTPSHSTILQSVPLSTESKAAAKWNVTVDCRYFKRLKRCYNTFLNVNLVCTTAFRSESSLVRLHLAVFLDMPSGLIPRQFSQYVLSSFSEIGCRIIRILLQSPGNIFFFYTIEYICSMCVMKDDGFLKSSARKPPSPGVLLASSF